MRALRIVGIAAGIAFVGVAVLFFLARFGDGPLGPIPGGPLTSGAWVREPVDDWSFAADLETVELQLTGDDTSRTVWILVREGGDAWIPASLVFPPGKRWHRRADAGDGHAVLRTGGHRYPVRLVRSEDPEVGADLRELVETKYGAAPPGSEGEASVWFFSVRSRAAHDGGG